MRITVTARDLASVNHDYLVLIHDESRQLYAWPKRAAQETIEACRRGMAAKRIKRPDVLPAPKSFSAQAILCAAISQGARRNWPESEQVRATAQEIHKFCEGGDKRRVAIALNGPDGPALAPLLAEGLVLGSYTFNDYRPARKYAGRASFELVVDQQVLRETRQAVKRAISLAECVNFARDLINRPGSVAVPSHLADQARQVAEETGLECEVLDEKRLAGEGYNGLITVGKSGDHPPCMVILRYRPDQAAQQPHLCLLGKGLTFDTGGLCIKSGGSMWEMISDMSGAAAVLAAMKAIATSRPGVNVTGIMVCAQNDVDARSVKPGDCFVARNGKSVHVLNTDAEGRLILTDGMFRAGEEGATHLVDAATLTGSCARALGESLSGLFCNDPEFQDLLRAAGETEGELMWPLPLFAEYRGMLDHYRTDINNVSKSVEGGAITAALFLQEFLPENMKWAHLDIAGTAFGKSSWRYLGPGGRGTMVRTFVRLAQKMAEGL